MTQITWLVPCRSRRRFDGPTPRSRESPSSNRRHAPLSDARSSPATTAPVDIQASLCQTYRTPLLSPYSPGSHASHLQLGLDQSAFTCADFIVCGLRTS